MKRAAQSLCVVFMSSLPFDKERMGGIRGDKRKDRDREVGKEMRTTKGGNDGRKSKVDGRRGREKERAVLNGTMLEQAF